MSGQVPRGGVHINATADDKPITYPLERLLGLLPTEEAAWNAVARLRDAGVSDDQIELFMGEEGERQLHSHHGQTGIRRLFVAMTRALGDEELESREYEEGIAAGNVLVAVRVPASEKNHTAEILKAEGGFWLRYYGPRLIEDIV